MQRLVETFNAKRCYCLRLVTVNGTREHYYEQDSKAYNCQLGEHGSPRQKMLKTQPSAGKAMVKVFKDAKGIITILNKNS